MSFIIQACYCKPTRYKNSRNSLMAFFLTGDSVTHCHHTEVSAVVPVSLQQQCWTKVPHRHKDAMDLPSAVICCWWLISKAARGVPEQHLMPFSPSFAELSCGVTCPASALILYSSALLLRLNRETQRWQKIVPKKAGFRCVFLSSWEICLKDSRGDSRTHSEHTYIKYPHYPYKLQLLPVSTYPACEIWKHITDVRGVKIDELKLLTN